MRHWQRVGVLGSVLILVVAAFTMQGSARVGVTKSDSGPTAPTSQIQPVNGKILPQYSAAFAAQQMSILQNCTDPAGCLFTNPTNGLQMLSGPKDPAAQAAISAHYASATAAKHGGNIALTGCGSSNSAWSTYKWTYTGTPFSYVNSLYSGNNESVDFQMLNWYNSSWAWCAAYAVNTIHYSVIGLISVQLALPVAGCAEPNGEEGLNSCGSPTYATDGNPTNGASPHSGYVFTYAQQYQVGGFWEYTGCGCGSPTGYTTQHDYPND